YRVSILSSRLYINISILIFYKTLPLQPSSTHFPYTTLFRSGTHRSTTERFSPKNPPPPFSRTGFTGTLSVASGRWDAGDDQKSRSEEHTSELQSRENLVCRLLLEKKKNIQNIINDNYLVNKS